MDQKIMAEPSTKWEDYGIFGKINYGNKARGIPYKRTLSRKIDKAKELISEFLDITENKVYVSVSFGVDSLVAWHMANEVNPGILCGWVNQGPLAEWPDCLALKDLLVSDYGMNLVEVQPDITLYDWYRRHGMPMAQTMDTAEDKKMNSALMYEPLNRFQEAHDLLGHIWGLRGKGEAFIRQFLLRSRGQIFKRSDKSHNGMWVCSPVAWWEKHEIFGYLDMLGLPYPAMYDIDRKNIRNGPPIGVTSINLGRVHMLKKRFPDIWKVFVHHFPEMQRFG